ncbi:MAG: MauE/DoxX family redox-associated membrane protein [Flavobacteriales bacterium]
MLARVVVSILFLVSAVSKMFPIWMFEKQLIDLGVASWCSAPYMARGIIGLELAIGLAILQRHYLKRLVIPGTMLLLAAFCVHLFVEMVKHGPMNGNCGCFGQLIPMTPLEAFIKNVITIGILVYIYRAEREIEKYKSRLLIPVFLLTISILFMFIFFPFCPCDGNKGQTNTEEIVLVGDSLTVDSMEVVIQQPALDSSNQIKPDSAVVVAAPPIVASRFADMRVFVQGAAQKKVFLDDGKKTICMFAPGCDHCRETAKQLQALRNQMAVPPIYILFMDEEADKIPEFISETGMNRPYKLLDIPKFWSLLGSNANVPGVLYMWNGNVMQSWEGIEGNQFNLEQFKTAIQKPFAP